MRFDEIGEGRILSHEIINQVKVVTGFEHFMTLEQKWLIPQ